MIRLGELGEEHAGELLTLQRAAFVTEAQRYREPHLPPLLDTLAELRAHLADPAVPTLGAWLGHRLIGAVRGLVTGDRLEIARLAVAPDQQGRGVGGALLTALETAAPPGIGTFWLATGAASAETLALYERRGYTRVAQRPDAAGVLLVVLEKPR